MAGSTTILDLIATAQAQKEVTANALFDATSPAALFGRRASTSAALTWGYYGGPMNVSGTLTQIPSATVQLADDATNYVEVDAAGAVSANTTAFTGGSTPLYTVITAGGLVSTYTDWRINIIGVAGVGSVSSVALTAPAEFTVSGSPVTQTGTLALTKANQDANLVWAGPSSGDAAAPAFRALVQADLPPQPFDAPLFFPGIPTDAQLLLRVPLARAITYPANMAGAYGTATAASTGTVSVDFQKNGVTFATATFTASDTPTWTTAGGTEQSFAAGDILSIYAPSTADATLADMGFVFAGTR